MRQTDKNPDNFKTWQLLTAQDLLAGSSIIHEIQIPKQILIPGAGSYEDVPDKVVRLRPLSVGILTIISKAAHEDASLVPLLMIKESLAEPALTLDQIRHIHIGLVHFLISRINIISGLGTDGDALEDAVNNPLGRTHILLAKHFGWTPEQVSQLTPGQVAVYLAGIQKLMEMESGQKSDT